VPEVKKAEPMLALPSVDRLAPRTRSAAVMQNARGGFTIEYKRLVHRTRGVVLDEILQPRLLVIRELSKFHTTSLDGNGAEGHLANLKVRYGFKLYLSQIKVTFGYDYV